MTRKRKSRSQRTAREPVLRVVWVRTPVRARKGRRLRVLIYARYSTDEQNPRSIEAQIAYCRRFLAELGITDADITVLFDRGISGERILRDGIDQVRKGIGAHQWDLILAEDCSRFFRNANACMELVYHAVDEGLRLISINDEIDTADDEYWEDRLYEAARHHERSNRFTSKRIKRAHEDLWQMGAAIGMLKTGYWREASHPAQGNEPEEGPYFDKIDEQQAPTIHDAFLRIAASESPWSVADRLTEAKLPKAANTDRSEWSGTNVIALIHRTDYRGFQTFRDTVSRKKHRLGVPTAQQNAPDKVLTRDMPHLRIVPDWLWYAANQAIAERAPIQDVPRGDDHPLAGIARGSRGPLSKAFICEICQQKMWDDGKYRCSHAHGGHCWNKATALKKWTEMPIARAIVHRLRTLGDRLDRLWQQACDLLDDHGRRQARRDELEAQQRTLEAALANLNDLAERAAEPPETVLARIESREIEVGQVRAELDGLAGRDVCFAPPTRQAMEERVESLIKQFQKMDRTVQEDLQCLVGTIRAVPYQQFGSNKVVLRARFQIRLWALLPFATRAALAARCDGSVAEQFESIPVLVDLFEPSTGPNYGQEALRLKEGEGEELGPTAIGRRLGITKRKADLALQFGKALRAARLTDPFIELKERPVAASRWRNRSRHKPTPGAQDG